MKHSSHWIFGACTAVLLAASLALTDRYYVWSAGMAAVLVSACWLRCWLKHYPSSRRTRMELFDRVISGGIGRQLLCFSLVTLAVVGVYMLVAAWTQRELSLGARFWWVLLRFIDPGQVAEERVPEFELLLPVLIALTGMVLLTGLLITTLSNIVERRVGSVENGLVVYRNISDHYVIIGYGEISVSLIKSLFERHGWSEQLVGPAAWHERRRLRAAVDSLPKIVILTNQPVAAIRAAIQSQLPADIEHKIIVYAGNIESYEHLASLNIDRAREVYVLGEQDEYGRDTKNLACVKSLSALRGDRDPLTVHVQFDRMPSFSAIQKLSVPQSYTCCAGRPNIYFRPFNFHENWARLLWCFYTTEDDDQSAQSCWKPAEEDHVKSAQSCQPTADGMLPLRFDRLDFRPMGASDHVHLLIVGFNRMGRALLLEALRICHYANYNAADARTRTRITVVDPDMERLRPFFESQYPHLAQIDDVEIDFRGVQAEQEPLRADIRAWASDPAVLLTVAVCLQDPDMSLAIGLNLPEEVYYQPGVGQDRLPRVLIRQELQCGLGELLSENKERFANVRIFGMLSHCIHQALFDDVVPRLLNGDHASQGELIESLYRAAVACDAKTFLDRLAATEAAWNVLQENMRWANRYQIDFYPYIRAMLAEKGIKDPDQVGPFDAGQRLPDDGRPVLDDATLEICACLEHRRWVAERTISGWRQARISQGEARENKWFIHDTIVPYDRLTNKDQKKDHRVVRNILKLRRISTFYEELQNRRRTSGSL